MWLFFPLYLHEACVTAAFKQNLSLFPVSFILCQITEEKSRTFFTTRHPLYFSWISVLILLNIVVGLLFNNNFWTYHIIFRVSLIFPADTMSAHCLHEKHVNMTSLKTTFLWGVNFKLTIYLRIKVPHWAHFIFKERKRLKQC